MSVHYRFKSALEYDTITFDGLHISVKDLKNAIVQQKRIGKSTDFDLRITNAQTQEVYEDDNALIPKNTSLLIARVPVATPKQKQWEGYGGNDTPPSKADEGGPIGKAMDLASLDAPEDDKIKAMMSQSTQDYDPSNYVKIRGANQVGPVPPSYRCYKCHQSGHWIKDCPLGQGAEAIEIKKSTGIPQSFLIPVEGPQVPGAMMMANGQYAVPALDLQAYTQKSTAAPAMPEQKPEIPEDLLCSICSDLLTDAVMIPCCGNSFCDECVRGVLLESEDHECPDCHEKGISPANLIPNRFLRKSVANFKNTTGYERIPTYRPKIDIPKLESPKKEVSSTLVADSTENDTAREEKTVISEADSTEQSKNQIEVAKEEDIQPEFPKVVDTDGPPGVSPKSSPVRNVNKSSDDDLDRTSKEREKRTGLAHKSRRSLSRSPKRSRNRRSPSFEPRHNDDRHGTPIRDEPSGQGNYIPPVDYYGRHPNDILPAANVLPTGRHMQGPPVGGGFIPGQPPPFHPAGPPPNFRLPPPGAPPPAYMAPGPYSVPPRPVFDPMALPPSNYVGNYVGRPRDYPERRRGRDMTPPGVIEDPLAAFNRILREKDEKRARQQRMARRSSYSRSRSRSRSFTRSPPPLLRRRSRSPLRRRMSRSRSRSFSKSRSRSRSYSHSPRGSSPPPSFRRSPPPLQARRGVVQGRYRSPIRSSPSRRRIERERDFDRGGYRDKPRNRRADSRDRDRFYDDRDRDFDRGVRGRLPPPSAPMQQPPPWVPPPHRDAYYPPEVAAASAPPPPFQNRYPQQIHHIQPERNYEGLLPPGIEQPPIPGLEPEPPTATISEFDKRKRNTPPRRERDGRHGAVTSPRDYERVEKREREKRKELKRSRSRSRTPEKWRNPSPKSTGTPERPKKRHSRSNSRDDNKKKDKERHRDHSEEDKNKKSKDKKKHKDKRDEKKKKKDKKDKHHRSKDKKDKKEEFKQIVPKSGALSDEEADGVKKSAHQSRKKHKEEDDVKRLAEERKKEERRLRFLDDDRRRKEEEEKREQSQKSPETEDKSAEEPASSEKLPKEVGNLYDEIIPEQDYAKEIRQGFNKDTEDTADAKQELPDKSSEPILEEQPSLFTNKDPDEDDTGILELHNDLDMKLDDILAPVPEKSKWDDDGSTINQEEDGQLASSPNSDMKDSVDSKSKVSNEILKRAENVIFAKAINSIRPLEVKKSSKLDDSKQHTDEGSSKIESSTATDKPRISVKERLGKKVDDPEPKIPPPLADHRRGSTSPFSRKERRIELEDRHRRHDRRAARSRDRGERNKSSRITAVDKANKKGKREEKDSGSSKHEDKATREKRKRSRSPSESEERKRRKKEKKAAKKEKDKSKKSEEDVVKGQEKQLKSAVEKRKPTLDEANFEPDYDLETIHEDDANETEKPSKKDNKVAARKSEATEEESSSSDSSSSSSEEEKKKRKKKRSRKKRKRRETSSSESESSSESSDSEKERRRKKHKKTKKKKKKSKH